MTVESKHPEWTAFRAEWDMVQDAIDGQRAIKSKTDTYLPIMAGYHRSDPRYKSYLQRAVFVNFTGRTKDGLVGAMFRKSPEVDIPEELDYLLQNSDGAGESLLSLTKDVAGEVISKGRMVLLVDYPTVDGELTLEDVNQLQPRASIYRYTCDKLVNWSTTQIGGRKKLSLAVLQELYDTNQDEFVYEEQYQYRVLRLVDGVYTQQLYRDDDPVAPPVTPRKADGSTFDYIPLFIVGSENNDETVDNPPLSDIAHVNVAHYRNSADLEENCHLHGQLTLGVSSTMSLTQFQEANPNGITVGAMAGHFLGESGGFSSVQASENQLADTLMARKEEQMRKLGARMIVVGSIENTRQTATQSKIDATGESSVLATIGDNVSEAIERCIGWVGEFMGVQADEAVYKLNKKFFDDDANPQLIMSAIQMNDRGIIAKSDMQNLARTQGIVHSDRTNEEIDGEIEIGAVLEQ